MGAPASRRHDSGDEAKDKERPQDAGAPFMGGEFEFANDAFRASRSRGPLKPGAAPDCARARSPDGPSRYLFAAPW